MDYIQIVQVLYFLLPAYIANMSPVIFRNRLNFLAKPMDFNLKFRGKPILGKNKTYRGLLCGTGMAILVAYMQHLAQINGVFRIELLDYSNWLLIGLLLGFGALIGDAAKSFLKRRAGIKSGESWKLFDQIDFVLGAMLFISPIFKINLGFVLTALLFSFILTIVANHFAFYIGLRKEKW